MKSKPTKVCCGCGKQLPTDKALWSISHTIELGAGLCTKCGQRETTNPIWADGRKVGWARVKATQEGQREYEKYKVATTKRVGKG